MNAYQPDPEWVTVTVRRTRAEQGLPPAIDDPLVYEDVAAFYGPWLDEQAAAKQKPHRARRDAA